MNYERIITTILCILHINTQKTATSYTRAQLLHIKIIFSGVFLREDINNDYKDLKV